MSRAVALVLALATATASSGCATYEGSRNTAGVSGVAFAASLATIYAGSQFHNEPAVWSGLAIGTASMMMVLGSAAGMAILPKRVEVALRIAHELVVDAEAGDCASVAQRRGEVQALDELVYEVILMEDPAVSECFGLSSSPSSSAPASPAVQERPDPASTSIVR